MVLEAAEGVLPRVHPTGLKAYKANAHIPIFKKMLAHRIVQKFVSLLTPGLISLPKKQSASTPFKFAINPFTPPPLSTATLISPN